MYMTLIPIEYVSDEMEESSVLIDEVYDSLVRDSPSVSTDHLLEKSQGDTSVFILCCSTPYSMGIV